MFDINFVCGVSLGPDRTCALGVGLPEDPDDEDEGPPLCIEWQSGSDPAIFELPSSPIGIAVAPESTGVPTLLVAYESGDVSTFSGDASTNEKVVGHRTILRDVRVIGRATYAVGMGRQVYRRSGPAKWTPISEEARPTTRGKVTGFNGIAGWDEENLIAVGYDGEIWRRRHGEWSQIESPTDLLLNLVEVVSPELAFACGLNGTLLRMRGETWQKIEHGREETESLIAMAYFRDRLYLSDGETLLRLEADDTLSTVDIGERKVGHLHAAVGAPGRSAPEC